MYEKFGELDSFIEINSLARKLKKEIKIEELYKLAYENGIPKIDVILYWGDATKELTDVNFAAADKIEMEKNNYLQEDHVFEIVNVEEIANYLKIKCYKDADFARNVRKRGKNFADCIGTLEGAYILLKEKFGKEKVTTEILGRVAEDFYNL